jgi:hypothetical protein
VEPTSPRLSADSGDRCSRRAHGCLGRDVVQRHRCGLGHGCERERHPADYPIRGRSTVYADNGYGLPTSTPVIDPGSISTGTGNAGTVSTGGTPDLYDIPITARLQPGVYWAGGVIEGVSSTQPSSVRYCRDSIPCEAFGGCDLVRLGVDGRYGFTSRMVGDHSDRFSTSPAFQNRLDGRAQPQLPIPNSADHFITI